MDYLGAFAVNAGKEVDELAEKYKADNDDFTSILVKSLGDRFAEATAEYAHKKIRDLWGFGESEGLSNEDYIAEKYRGIRPAAGYPCQPDHTEKDLIWDLLDVKNQIGLELTESRAMNPLDAQFPVSTSQIHNPAILMWVVWGGIRWRIMPGARDGILSRRLNGYVPTLGLMPDTIFPA